jgi:flotillin
VDKITIGSTGNGTTAGASKITGDMAAIAAQVPALFEALSGMSMAELFSKVKQIGDNGPKPAPELPSGENPGGKAKAAAKA